MKWIFAGFLFLYSLGAHADQQWRTIPQKDLVYLQLEHGLVVIELAPFMAPHHVQRFRNLVEEGFYNGLSFYRVIDGFVAQGGDMSEKKASQFRQSLKAEVSRKIDDKSDFISVQKPALLADESGYIQGFPAGRDNEDKQEWLLHCPGAVAMARNNPLNSASTEFYIVIGQAPRHLDRNMSTFGRVIYGMEHIQALNRAKPSNASGVIKDQARRDRIRWASTGDKLKSISPIHFEAQRTDSPAFQQRLANARQLSGPFYHHQGSGNIDVCYYRPKVRVKQL